MFVETPVGVGVLIRLEMRGCAAMFSNVFQACDESSVGVIRWPR